MVKMGYFKQNHDEIRVYLLANHKNVCTSCTLMTQTNALLIRLHAALCSDPHLTMFFLLLPRRVEDEAVLDRGAAFVKHVCDEEEVEGKLSDEREREREKKTTSTLSSSWTRDKLEIISWSAL